MANDISQAPGRTLSQRRITLNRSDVSAGRRETGLAGLDVKADLRSASRGDGGAGDLQRTLSGFLQSAQGVYETETERRKPMYEAEAAAGAEAQTLGNVDPAVAARSLSYRTAVNGTRARQTVVTTGAAIDEAVTALIARSEANDDPLDPSDDFGIEDVEDGLNQIISNVLFDEDGKALEWGDADSHMTVIQGIARLKNEAFIRAETAIRGQVRENHVRTLGVGIALDVTQYDGSTPINFEAGVAAAREGGWTAAESVPRLLDDAISAAQQHDKADALDALALSVRADGQPSFNAAQMTQLRNNADNIRDRVERETDEKNKETSAATLSSYLITGRAVPMSTIQADHAAGRLDADGVRMAIAHNEHVDDRAYMMQGRANAAADRAYSLAHRGGGGGGGRRSGGSADTEDELIGALHSGARPADILNRAARDLQSGRLDAAEYRRVVRDVGQAQTDAAEGNDSATSPHRRTLDTILSVPELSTRARSAAVGRYQRDVRDGVDPALALANTLVSVGVTPDRAARAATR